MHVLLCAGLCVMVSAHQKVKVIRTLGTSVATLSVLAIFKCLQIFHQRTLK
jgi:hypothetical protein